MPANEQTWRNIPLLHRVFAVSGIAMFVSTIWVFWADQNREWRGTQSKVVDVDTTMIQWRELQYKTDDAQRNHEVKGEEKLRADAAFIDPARLQEFATVQAKLNADMERLGDKFRASYDHAAISKLQQDQAEAATNAEAAWQVAIGKAAAAEQARRDYLDLRSAAKPNDEANLKTLNAALANAEQAEKAALMAKREATEQMKESAEQRRWIVARLDAVVKQVKSAEELALGDRKFKSAEVDAARANVDIGVRDSVAQKEMARLEKNVIDRTKELQTLNLNYQAKNEGRLALQKLVLHITARQAAAAKELETVTADLQALEKAYAVREEPYFIFYDSFPYFGGLGKGLLNLPILNAFNPPQKIENLWSTGLMQNYNHSIVRRFDRCTTCHQLMQRTLPNQPQDPAYIHQQDLVIWLTPPEQLAENAVSTNSDLERLEKTYGLRLADRGLVTYGDVTVSLVLPQSPAAKAEIESAGSKSLPAEELRKDVAHFTAANVEPINFKVLPGLLVGDVIVYVEDDKAIRGPVRVAEQLLGAVGKGKPVKLTVRRGLANPFTTHPRLDLFAGDASPHPMGTFGCTICHDGQGNATAFKWASHTPDDSQDDPEQSNRWTKEHGWFDNHHWIYPMWPKRFAESGCLKCHHEVVELEPSEKFPEPAAPKLTHGYHLIRKYGCYGCHEMNGYDGPKKRIGPDLRTEPNFFASALQLGHLLAPRLTELEQAQKSAQARFEELHNVNVDSLSEAERKDHATEMAATEAEARRLTEAVASASRALELAPEVASRSYDNAARTELYQLFTADAGTANVSQRAFTPEMHRTANVLKDVEAPGSLRKPGPTLRFVREKLDPVFIYDWTNNPKNFRPTTRMPRFFGLWDHLQDAEPKSMHRSEELEPVEIHGIVTYLQKNSQPFTPLEKPSGIADDPPEERIARGKMLFETRGCLACHEHHDFPTAKEYRGKQEIVQGPELSAIAEKFDPQRNPKGKEWLYSWIKNPSRYNVRTLMPNVFLDPITEQRPTGEKKDDGSDVKKSATTDPAADIVEYLLDASHLAAKPATSSAATSSAGHDHRPWQPVAEANQPVDANNLKSLVIEYLRESFHESRLEEYYDRGLPERMRSELKVAEQDLVVPEGGQLTDEQRLLYVGRKTITKFGCYGCHDVPGFEDAKPIGTGLADWGRKDPSRLAFEHISHYLEHGHGTAGQSHAGSATDHEHGTAGKSNAPVEHEDHGTAGHHSATHSPAGKEKSPVYYQRALDHGNRIGFIYQKLLEPRSYDFEKTTNKKYNDRLRMPEFPFNTEEREAVITFVLGLVADPPTEKYLYKPSEREKAIVAGKQVLEMFNCGGCHVLEGERWKLSVAPDAFGESSPPNTFPFALHSLDPGLVAKSNAKDRRGLVESELRGLPSLESSGDNGALPVVRAPDGTDYEDEERAQPRLAKYEFSLFQAAAVGGKTYQPSTKLEVDGQTIARKYPTQGGYLTKYLSPVVYALEKKTNPNAKGHEVYGWLPPPLMGEGKKVQTAWLYDFLMEPHAIRPATFLRMPKFNLSPDDASKLVNYFAVKDNASYPYEFDPRRQSDHLASRQATYAHQAADGGEPEENQDRLEAALKTVTNRTYCVQCHSVADFQSDNSPRAQGPNLAQVYKRLRPDYTRRWIANPQLILPYTAMPENIKYNPEAEQISDKWYHGSRTDQVDGLVDLLMNFDEYAKRQARIADLVPPPAKADQPAEPAAAESTNSEAGP